MDWEFEQYFQKFYDSPSFLHSVEDGTLEERKTENNILMRNCSMVREIINNMAIIEADRNCGYESTEI